VVLSDLIISYYSSKFI